MKLELSPGRIHPAAFTVIEIGDGVILKRGRTEVKIAGDGAGETVRQVVDAARGGASRAQIIERFPPPERQSAENLVDHLLSRRFLLREDQDGPPETGADALSVFYWHFGTDARRASERFRDLRVRIFGLNHITRHLLAGLRESGAGPVELTDYAPLRNDQGRVIDEKTDIVDSIENLDPESMSVIVATSDNGSVEPLRVLNEFAVLHRIYFLPVQLRDLVGQIGPLVLPGETPCYECLRLRQNAHLADPAASRASEAALLHSTALNGFHASMPAVLGHLAAMELTKYFCLGPQFSRVGTLIDVNLLGAEIRARQVLKAPRCPVCSTLNRRPSIPLTRTLLLGGEDGEQ